MLNYTKIVLLTALLVFLTACGNTGLANKGVNYNVDVDLNIDSILTSDEGETSTQNEVIAHGKPSYLNQHSISISPKTVETLTLSVLSTEPIVSSPLKYIRANDIIFSTSEEEVKLYNNGYTKIKSLIGKYVDEHNLSHFVKLAFNEPVDPYTMVKLQKFDNADTMQIVHTSTLLNQAIKYGGADCDHHTDDTNNIKYCMPTVEEQHIYSHSIATLHHFYNSSDALASYIAWNNQEAYSTLKQPVYGDAFSTPSQEEMIKTFMKATLPDNLMTLKSTYYVKEHDGVATGENTSLMGIKESKGWTSIWHEYLVPKEFSDLSASDMFSLMHHEMMHARGFTHASCMTYGFSGLVGDIIEHFYDQDSYPVSEAPKYFFDLESITDSNMLVSVYTHLATQSSEITLEALSSEPLGIKASSAELPHQIKLKMTDKPSLRFYLRIYAEDSKKIMSKLIYPYAFASRSEEITQAHDHYHIVPHKNWKHLAQNNEESIHMKAKDAEHICKSWTGSLDAKTEELRKVETFEIIEKPLLVHSPFTYKEYYSHSSYETTMLPHETNMSEHNVSILCKVER